MDILRSTYIKNCSLRAAHSETHSKLCWFFFELAIWMPAQWQSFWQPLKPFLEMRVYSKTQYSIWRILMNFFNCKQNYKPKLLCCLQYYAFFYRCEITSLGYLNSRILFDCIENKWGFYQIFPHMGKLSM